MKSSSFGRMGWYTLRHWGRRGRKLRFPSNNQSFRSLKWTCDPFRCPTLFAASLNQGAKGESECCAFLCVSPCVNVEGGGGGEWSLRAACEQPRRLPGQVWRSMKRPVCDRLFQTYHSDCRPLLRVVACWKLHPGPCSPIHPLRVLCASFLSALSSAN